MTMPDTPTVNPLVDEGAAKLAARNIRLVRQRHDADYLNGSEATTIEAAITALRPVEAYDAGLIGELETCAGQSELGRNLAGTPQVCRRAAARLASLSAAKVEAEKEMERLTNALERLDRNFDLLLRGKPVRDVAETKAEVAAAPKGRAQGDGR